MKSEVETERLYDQVMALTTTIEEAIIKGQKSAGVLGDIVELDSVSEDDSAFACGNVGPRIVGWVDDL